MIYFVSTFREVVDGDMGQPVVWLLSVLSTEKRVVSHVQSIDVNHDSVRPQIVFNSGAADLQFDLEHTKHMKQLHCQYKLSVASFE